MKQHRSLESSHTLPYKTLERSPLLATSSLGHYASHREPHEVHRSYNTNVSSAGPPSSFVQHSTFSRGTGSVISERYLEHRIKVPKKIVREELYENVVVVPERRIAEEFYEEEQIVREKIVEIAKPVYRERIVEVPEYEYVDKIVEVPEIIVQERIHQIPKVQVIERIRKVPKIIRQEKIVEIPQIQYKDVPVIRRVEVPKIREEVIVRERRVPQYVSKPEPHVVEHKAFVDVPIKVPVPLAAEVVYRYEVPQIEPHVKTVEYPLYVPRFVEVPVARPFIDQFMEDQAARIQSHVSQLEQNRVLSMCEIENVASAVRNAGLVDKFKDRVHQNGESILLNNFRDNRLSFSDSRPLMAEFRKSSKAKRQAAKYANVVACDEMNSRGTNWNCSKATTDSPRYPIYTTPRPASIDEQIARSRRGDLENRFESADDCTSASTSSCSACQASLRRLRNAANRRRRPAAGGVRWR